MFFLSTRLFWKLDMCPLMSNHVKFILFIITHSSMYLGAEIFDNIHNEEMKENRIEGTGTNMTGKVVGGEYVSINEYPHSVYLMAYCNEQKAGEYWTCGSAVLTQNILLSAGHCVEGCRAKFKILAFAGNSNVEKARIMRQVRRYILHSEYNSVTVFADISMLFFNKELPLGRDIKRVIVRPTFPMNTEAKLAGWGVIDEDRTPTNKLKAVSQKVWTLANCAKQQRVLIGTMCAASGSKDDYPFSGDSGSALITQDKQAIGLVSYRDDSRHDLIVYTNVSYYYLWIRRYSKSLYCNYQH